MAPPRRKKKTRAVIRRRSGIAAAPFERGLEAVMSHCRADIEKKDLAGALKAYARTIVSKDDMKYFNANPDYKFHNYTHYCATAAFIQYSTETNEKVEYWKDCLKRYVLGLVETGRELYNEAVIKKADSDAVRSISPMERLQNKVKATVAQSLLDLEDKWIEGEKATLDLYQEFKKHGLPASAAGQVRGVVEGWLLDYEDAYHKRCPDAVEGYSHLKRPELNHRIKACQSMLSDLDRLKSAAKAIRKTKVKGPKAADKQVARVQYKTEDNDFKLVSIPPIQIVGRVRLYTFNTKSRVLTEYITTEATGFEVSGTSIKNFNKASSRAVRLRKPDDFIPIALNKTPKQIDGEWKNLTTKTSVPNGRLNKDTILLRVMDK